MKITYKNINIIANDIKDKVVSNHISNIVIINSTDILFTFSFYRKEKLLISLNHTNPFISFIKNENNVSTILGKVNDTLRKEIRDGHLVDVKPLNKDRVVEFSIYKVDEYYQKQLYYLIVELIPTKPNLLILDKNRNVIYATHFTGLDATRLVLKDQPYTLIEKNKDVKIVDDNFNLEEFKDYANKYYEEALIKRKNEKFAPLYHFLKNKKKSLERKLISLNKEIDNAKNASKYLEIGNALLAYINNEDELKDYLKENNIKYDELMSVSNNAQSYFKKYKKCKRALDMAQNEIDTANKLIDEYSLILNSWPYYNDEELMDLESIYVPKKKKKKIEHTALLPSYILVNKTKIGFGKNNKQNEYLTFKLAKKDDTYLHIKDYHGAHVVIFNDNPSDEELLIASEIALLLSNKESGNIIYTKVNNLKKSPTSGQVTFNTYKEITLNSIRATTKELLLSARKFNGK